VVTAVNSTLDRLPHHCAHMNNKPPPTLSVIYDLIQSHLELLQQQLESSSNPHITHLLQSQFHSHLTQILLSIQSYTSQQSEILHLTQTPPLNSYPTTFTPQPHPQHPNRYLPTPQPNGFATRQGLRCQPWTHLQHHLKNLGRVQTPRSPILRCRIQVFSDLH
jgi:hypothetical protein